MVLDGRIRRTDCDGARAGGPVAAGMVIMHEYEIIEPTFLNANNLEIIRLWLNGNEALGLEFVCMYGNAFVFKRHNNTDHLEQSARRLLTLLDVESWRITAQTFGKSAAEIGEALKELREILNEAKNDAG